MSGRLLKWAVELSELDINYRPITTIKGQVLADFIMEKSDARKQEVDNEKWVLETDGSSRDQGESAASGIIMKSLHKQPNSPSQSLTMKSNTR